MTNNNISNGSISHSEYITILRPFLPPEAFLPDNNKILILFINIAILILGWGTAHYLDQWTWYLLWLFLPLAVIMGNSIIVLLFSTHDLMHSKSINNNSLLKQSLYLLGLTMLWMPPTLWLALHNRQHHHNTNTIKDPDRSYLFEHPNNWGKWIQNRFAPSSEVSSLELILGLASAWGIYTFRNLTSILFFNNGLPEYLPRAFKVNQKQRRTIALEILVILGIHLGIINFVGLHPIKLLLGYFLPIWIGYAGVIFYIYTNHLLCPMKEINDPLLNTLSVRVPRIFDCLHLNFSYHTEHHLFPGLNSDYYPMVQALLLEKFPDRLNLLLMGDAWRLLLKTPRYYKTENILTDWTGTKSSICPASSIGSHAKT